MARVTLEEIREKERQGIVHACPQCGKQYMTHCHHGGQNVNARFMKVEEAKKIVKRTIVDLESDIDEFRLQLAKYEKLN